MSPPSLESRAGQGLPVYAVARGEEREQWDLPLIVPRVRAKGMPEVWVSFYRISQALSTPVPFLSTPRTHTPAERATNWHIGCQCGCGGNFRAQHQSRKAAGLFAQGGA
ncbi:hypothetical protein DPEC_G00124730 [Dallia pectoralis]|uniref:Uncharacterized protein n=1 Tax=Dallia pectoralis TaxID=75939 RepID=A0ACC2GRQ6_DALPE|nr:hypothetical protein DPEC_G00124730 [Dallia pectoralis]